VNEPISRLCEIGGIAIGSAVASIADGLSAMSTVADELNNERALSIARKLLKLGGPFVFLLD
jgi:hypothetical protein